MSARRASGCQACSCGSAPGQIRKPHKHSLGEDDEAKEVKEFVIPTIDCGSHVCIVEPCAKDMVKVDNQIKLAKKVWKLSRPPHGFSRPVSTITARKVQVTRAQLLGQLAGSPISPIPCPPAVCAQSLINPRPKDPDTSIIFEASTMQRKRTTQKANFS